MSLENFKKQAKLLVRWHRERNYSVGGRIRQLPRYEDLTDTEALALPFPLNEAQEIIALEQGYNGWAELRQGLKKAPKATQRASAALKLAKAMPVLYVSDVQAARELVQKVKFPPVGDRGLEGKGLETNFGLDIPVSRDLLVQHALR